jgi:Yip1 domain
VTLVDRVKNICLTPATEWGVIAGETTPTGTLISSYVVPLAAIGAVAGFISASLIGSMIFGRTGLAFGLTAAVISFVSAIVGVVIVSLIINALAPSFGGEKNSAQAMKVAVYSFTPAWVAAAFRILPILGSLLALLGALYGLYLLYLGLPRLMKSPEDKTLGYTVVVVIGTIFVYACLAVFGGIITGAGMLTSGALGGLTSRVVPSSETTFAKDSPLGKLEELGKKLDESNKKMEAAEKKGDSAAQVGAALEGLGTLLGGGKKVDPLGIDQLKAFVPEQFAGLPKTRSNAEKNGFAGLMVSKAEATYSDGGQKEVTLEFSDAGGMSGLVGLAGWANVMGEKDNDDVSERTSKVNGRIVHESLSKRAGGRNEFDLVLGDRFIVSAKGEGVSLNELKSAVGSLDLAKLEGMKDVGVQK